MLRVFEGCQKVLCSRRLGFFCMGVMMPPLLLRQAATHPKGIKNCPRDLILSLRGSFACGKSYGISYSLGIVAGSGTLVFLWKAGSALFHARGF